MKTVLLSALLLGLAASRAAAAVQYSGSRIVIIPFDVEGSYLNPLSGQTATRQPGDFYTAPWINPFFGGSLIATSSRLRPVISGPPPAPGEGQAMNMAAGMMIGPSSLFTAGTNGSESHVGSGPGYFQPGVPGYLGFTVTLADSLSANFGWLRLAVNNNGSGILYDWAWDDSGAPIAAGFTGIPEPGADGLLAAATMLILTWRRR